MLVLSSCFTFKQWYRNNSNFLSLRVLRLIVAKNTATVKPWWNALINFYKVKCIKEYKSKWHSNSIRRFMNSLQTNSQSFVPFKFTNTPQLRLWASLLLRNQQWAGKRSVTKEQGKVETTKWWIFDRIQVGTFRVSISFKMSPRVTRRHGEEDESHTAFKKFSTRNSSTRLTSNPED